MLGLHQICASDLHYFIYINDVTENLQSSPKLFADITFLFTIINDPNATTKQPYEELNKINEWTFRRKISFSPEPSKKSQEFIFTCRNKKVAYPSIFLNDKPFQQHIKKHLGTISDICVTFDEHIKAIIQSK